jgi:hypothetical protein
VFGFVCRHKRKAGAGRYEFTFGGRSTRPRLAPGDVETVTRIDRLARSTFDLLGMVKRNVDVSAIPVSGGTVGPTSTSTGRSEASPVSNAAAKKCGSFDLRCLGQLAHMQRTYGLGAVKHQPHMRLA